MIESNNYVCRKCGNKMNTMTEISKTKTSTDSGASITTSTIDRSLVDARNSDPSSHPVSEINTPPGSSGYAIPSCALESSGYSGSCGTSFGITGRNKITYKCEQCGHEVDKLIDY